MPNYVNQRVVLSSKGKQSKRNEQFLGKVGLCTKMCTRPRKVNDNNKDWFDVCTVIWGCPCCAQTIESEMLFHQIKLDKQ